MFENHAKCRIGVFQFWRFPPIFVLLKLTCLVTLFDQKLQVFFKKKTRQNEPFLAFFLNFWPLAMLNATISGIFKHGAQVESDF